MFGRWRQIFVQSAKTKRNKIFSVGQRSRLSHKSNVPCASSSLDHQQSCRYSRPDFGQSRFLVELTLCTGEPIPPGPQWYSIWPRIASTLVSVEDEKRVGRGFSGRPKVSRASKDGLYTMVQLARRLKRQIAAVYAASSWWYWVSGSLWHAARADTRRQDERNGLSRDRARTQGCVGHSRNTGSTIIDGDSLDVGAAGERGNPAGESWHSGE